MKFRERLARWLLGTKSIPSSYMLPSWQDRQAVWSDWSGDRAIKEGYKANTWVYACVRRLMAAASSVPWIVEEYRQGDWQRRESHPLEQLIEYPNQYMSRQDLMETLISHLYLAGNGIWSVIDVRGVPVELWPMPVSRIRPVPSRSEFIAYYEYDVDGQKKKLEADEVLHFMFVDPANAYWGMAPLQAAARIVDTDNEAISWNKVALQNRAVADGVFSTEQPLTQTQWEELRKQVREQHQGSANARTPWILGAGAKWHQMSMTPAEMDFIASRRLTREEICAVFGVPPVLVGILDKATYSNYEQAQRSFWLDTVIPLLDDIKSALNLSLVRRFGDLKKLRIRYDTSNVKALEENFHDKVKTAQALWSMGVPFNQINQRLELGFDDVPGGDESWLPMSLLPAGTAVQRQDAEGESKSKGLFPSGFKAFNLETEEQKSRYWKAVDNRRLQWEKKVKELVAKLFDEEGKAVETAFKAGNDVDAAIEQQTEAWTNMFKAFYIAVIEDFGQETGENVVKALFPGKRKWAFDPWKAIVQDWIEDVVAEKIMGMTATTKQQVKAAVQTGFENGETTEAIALRIKNVYENFSRVRALVIARTEVVAASSAGSHFGVAQTGLNYDRVWLSSRDDRVRDDHDEMDGQVVGQNEPFLCPDGSRLMFPGDTSMGAAASQTIMCRCTETYRIKR